MIRNYIIASALVATVTGALAHAPVHSVQTATGELREQTSSARLLAELLVPKEFVIAEAERRFREGFAQESKTNPQSAELEQKFPGIAGATSDAGAKAVREVYAKAWESDVAEVAALLNTQLSAEAIQLNIAFYRSPTGVKFQQWLSREVSFSQSGASGDGTVTFSPGDFRQVVAPDRLKGFTEAERAEIFRHSASDAGKKLSALSLQLAELYARQNKAVYTPANIQKIQEAIGAGAEAFLAAKSAAQ